LSMPWRREGRTRRRLKQSRDDQCPLARINRCSNASAWGGAGGRAHGGRSSHEQALDPQIADAVYRLAEVVGAVVALDVGELVRAQWDKTVELGGLDGRAERGHVSHDGVQGGLGDRFPATRDILLPDHEARGGGALQELDRHTPIRGKAGVDGEWARAVDDGRRHGSGWGCFGELLAAARRVGCRGEELVVVAAVLVARIRARIVSRILRGECKRGVPRGREGQLGVGLDDVHLRAE